MTDHGAGLLRFDLGRARPPGRHAGEAMKLLTTGVSHKTAPVEVRECLAFRAEALPAALADLKSARGSGRSRHPLHLQPRGNHRHHGGRRSTRGPSWRRFWEKPRPSTRAPSRRICTATRGARPSITCSAWRPAWIPWWWASRRSWASSRTPTPPPRAAARCAAGWRGCTTRAFGVAKRVRSETGIGQMAVSVSYAAVELARKIFGSLDHRTIMIVGAGKMSELAARHLRRSGASHVFVTNRTHERAVEMASAVSGHAGGVHALHRHAARGGYPDRLLGRAALHPAQGRDAARHRGAPQQADVPDRYRRAAQHRAGGQRDRQRLSSTTSTTCRKWSTPICASA